MNWITKIIKAGEKIKTAIKERASKEDQAFLNEAAPTNATGSSIANWYPILISLVRRAMPNLIAYDIAGVQPMTGQQDLSSQ